MVILLMLKFWCLSLCMFIYIVVNLGDENNSHACQTGHQLRAMAGTKFEITQEASLFQCEKMEDNNPIIVRGTKKKWSEFKKDHPDWDFGSANTPEELFKLRGKFLNVWSKIGRRLCEMYDMKFVTENTPQAAPKPFHYILMLDASGSMGLNKHKPWNDLLSGVKEFLNVRIDCGSQDRITIITFHNQATYACFNADIKTVNISNIECTKGGTDFGEAFDLVIETIKNTAIQNSSSSSLTLLDYIIIFMSDGDALYPTIQLEALSQMEAKINQFWTVALGNTKMDVLEQINHKMSGSFKEMKDSADLVHVYAEIARN